MASNLGYRETEHSDPSDDEESENEEDDDMHEDGVNGNGTNMGYFSQFSESWNEAGDFNRTNMSMMETLKRVEEQIGSVLNDEEMKTCGWTSVRCGNGIKTRWSKNIDTTDGYCFWNALKMIVALDPLL